MTQLSIAQYGYLIDAVGPFLHILLLGSILLILLEAAVLLGDVLGSGDRHGPDA
jgi:hypothetical protein